jgi:hypothetical protein
MANKKYDFGEKTKEYDASTNKNVEVWQSPKYLESKKKVIEMIESEKYGLEESDFWILMNKTKSGKMAYTGLIISHNGCLKINDALEEKMKFKPSCVVENKEGYENSLVFSYSNDEQGIYEVGEVSTSNYKQKTGRYPYAMAYKRLFDRVVLKNSKLAYAGVYSDSEADEFKEPIDEKEVAKEPTKKEQKVAKSGEKVANTDYRQELIDYCKSKGIDIVKVSKAYKLNTKTTAETFKKVLEDLIEKGEKENE